MGRVWRPPFTDRKTGERRVCKNYHAEWQGADGKTHRKAVSPDKREALDYLARMHERERRIRLGIEPDVRRNPDLNRPLQTLLIDYLALLEAKDVADEYRKDSAAKVTAAMKATGWTTFETITGDSFTLFMGARRKAGNAPTTINNYLATVRSFTRWLADRVGQPDPLRKLQRVPVTERRRSKRILTDDELAALLATTERGKRKGNYTFAGLDRAMLYRVAAYTGLRASELASLTPERFTLDTSPPLVIVEAVDAKGKRLEPIPLPADLAGRLRKWMRNKPRKKKLWPGDWAKKKSQVDWIATDLKRAGVVEFDEKSRRATFHGLRRGYITRIIRAGAKIHEVRRLARHTDVKTTLEYYTDETLADLGAIVDRLPG